jgi:hypothetical protein
MAITGAEIAFGFQALRQALSIAKDAKELTDSVTIRAKVSEMYALILEAQESAINAREAHTAQIDRIRDLEAEIARFKTWDGEKQRYELKTVCAGAFAFMLKKESRGTEPAHWLCPNCFERGQKSYFQNDRSGRRGLYTCQACEGQITAHNFPVWL